jgi:hypothetical protein
LLARSRRELGGSRMAESRDFSNAASGVSTAYAYYLLRAAAHSVRSLHLYEQVIGCVARRQLSPETLQDSLTRFAHARAGEASMRATAATARFVAGLASSTFVPVDGAATPVDVDAADLPGSLERLADHAAAHNARAIETLLSQLATVAAGEITTDDFRRAIVKRDNRAIAGELSRCAHLWFELLSELDELRAHSAEQYLMGVLRNVNPIGFEKDVVELAGPVNTTISTVVSLENTRRERAVIQCSVSDVRRANGIGPAFMPDVVLTPEELSLDCDGEASVRLSLWLDDAIYEVGSPYVGALHISLADEPQLDLPLRITPTVSIP